MLRSGTRAAVGQAGDRTGLSSYYGHQDSGLETEEDAEGGGEGDKKRVTAQEARKEFLLDWPLVGGKSLDSAVELVSNISWLVMSYVVGLA